jgi:hypothetical protein
VARDWYAWHLSYTDPDSRLSRRLRTVQREITRWLDARPEPDLRVVSACAGQGRDLLDVLAQRPSDAVRVHARLIEYDERNLAQAKLRAAELPLVTVVRADAGKLASYAGAVPADLVLLAGVFGNITEADIQRTIAALPQLCATGASVIWTKSRQDGDRTPAVRGWFAEHGFTETAFHAPTDAKFSVGVHRLRAEPEPLDPSGELFTFVT